ncbi:hypothetical protein QFC22_000361 [Naganishia vaughanmartiniae]|uniref:Uncharacterized protein n=1 Tax=Naganishia vaughanmartiniae TaxID=1424756 RepID=A0ACC2XPW8_9TREE|nr:hypothetical protein QFC22_000361 [Naganishia vaughanmartiniae]
MNDADWDSHNDTAGLTSIPHSHTHWERLTSTYADAGYREGITPGKLSTLQRGFDEAFAGSVVNSRRLGQVRGRVAGLVAFLSTQTQSRNDLAPASSSSITSSTLLQRAKETRAYLSRIPRDLVLPVDEEAIAHAAAEHPEEHQPAAIAQNQNQSGVADAWTQEGQQVRERREMDRVLDAFEDLSASASASPLGAVSQAKGKETAREQQLLDLWEGRVAQLELEAGL